MDTASLCSASLPLRPCSTNRRTRLRHREGASAARVFASRRSEAHDRNYSGRLVDENLIVLRKRIHEMKMLERNYEPPSHWMNWEKWYYPNYDSSICEAMGLLQSQLMKTRPSLALLIALLVALSVPISTSVLFFHLVEITNGLLA
ncbi:uncharacterized protein LOC131154275 [Malania oleifera]|uniref:uncharacterized protein LOC131154275 n=1 Tax=Malania oleifera TaxID=397392 RepID=UPI0025AE15BB|nr:uncharacterized protein LOC131154275 [Malania oleifera]